jgi:hypothetical protein
MMPRKSAHDLCNLCTTRTQVDIIHNQSFLSRLLPRVQTKGKIQLVTSTSCSLECRPSVLSFIFSSVLHGKQGHF